MSSAAPAPNFVPGHSVERALAQHRRLPATDIWWTVNGPDMSWNNRNLQQLFPSVPVYRDGPVRELARAEDPRIGSFRVIEAKANPTLDRFLASDDSTALGLVILHEGRVVYERYPRMQRHEKPIYWSVAKVFVGLLVRLLEEEGRIDVSAPIERYLPELKQSSLAGTPIRALLDMANGLDCADDYEDWSSCYYRFSMAIGDGYRTADAPSDPYEFVRTAKIARVAPPGTVFSYSGLNTFVLSWLVERVTGMPFADAFSARIWTHIGARADAAYMAPFNGVPITPGGFYARLTDLARFGLLYTDHWRQVSLAPIVTSAHRELLLRGGDPGLRANAGLPDAATSGIQHNVYQWDAVFTDGTLYKGGWAGQGLIVNPDADLVVVFAGYFKDAEGSETKLTPIVFRLIRALFLQQR
ncbi:MAG: serine hydrolase domain-containing protein [Pseudomonadota bacterium]